MMLFRKHELHNKLLPITKVEKHTWVRESEHSHRAEWAILRLSEPSRSLNWIDELSKATR